MKLHIDIQKSKILSEKVKWVLIFFLLMMILMNHYYFFHHYSYSIRMLMDCIFICIIGIIFIITQQGKMIRLFFREARIEARKVVWPTYQETFYTTLIVSIVTIIMSLIIWILDSILVKIISFVTRLRMF
ncbi:preprotein translocase subunit SecE [Candidatus Schneideria nysicola]|uniref:preprotein translocase subunit SecE n=1 Tax=Candidatus Schneideria nysicola TaxID=1081631 RepID=UPI001CAA51CD|nr:preprotein translocase subunit SecE [Candidatus Schneideria nysicola]UAJ64955.1 preprotein translocase subunit SecE [Candidatus Schneideria nysicola]